MGKFFKGVFFGACSLAVSACLFSLFGAIAAFVCLALSAENPKQPDYTDASLARFLDSPEKSASFTAEELSAGLFGIVLEAAKEQASAQKRGVAAPEAPAVLLDDAKIEVCVPFAAVVMSRYIVLGAYVGLEFDGSGCSVVSGRIGNARLPRPLAVRLGRTLLGFYSHLKPAEKYIAAFDKMKIVSDSGKAVLTK